MMNCPVCGHKGKAVKPITLDALLRSEAKGRTKDIAYRFCRTRNCDVVYFAEDGSVTFTTSDLTVRVGLKEIEFPRPVCYCFDYTVEDIEGQVALTGNSTIPEEIAAKCRQGFDRCEETNPQGSCCLGNVRAVLKAAQGESEEAVVVSESSSDCCGNSAFGSAREVRPSGSRAGVWTAGVALFSAVASSACCWLPLLLITFGASAAGVAGFFETYRVPFLVATVLLLGTGFYLVYFRKEPCNADGTCPTVNPRLQRVNRVFLWTAAVLVLGFALFPNYVGALLGEPTDLDAEIISGPVEITVEIEGMTCDGCATVLEGVFRKVPGVTSSTVSYEKKQAKLTTEPDVTDEIIRQVVKNAGYSVKELLRNDR